MTLEQLIRELQAIRKADPTAGKKPVYAGDTNLILVGAVSSGATNIRLWEAR